MTDSTHDIKPGDFLVETLVTDTVGWYVTKVTAKSIWVVPAVRSGLAESPGAGDSPYPVVLSAIEAPAEIDPEDERRLGLRKGGIFKSVSYGRPLRPAPTTVFEGHGELPYVKTDYSF